MAGVNRVPATYDPTTSRIRTEREARLIEEQTKHVGEEEIERELETLDDDIAGTDHDELARMRARAREGSK